MALFEDVIESLQARDVCTNKKLISFIYHNKVPVSFLVSKDDLKLRLQCPDFASVWFVLSETVRRLHALFANPGKYPQILNSADDPLQITFPDAIPLNELFTVIDEHAGIRAEMTRLRKALEDRTYQFRVIQKRLLNRFKVRSIGKVVGQKPVAAE